MPTVTQRGARSAQLSGGGCFAKVGTVATVYLPQGITASPDGKSVYTSEAQATGGNYNLFTTLYSISGGLLTYVAGYAAGQQTSPAGSGFTVPIVSPDNNNVYSMSYGSTIGVYQWSRNTSTGVLTALSPTFVAFGTAPVSPGPANLIITPDGKWLYVCDSTNINRFSRSGGLLTALTATTVHTAGASALGVSPDGNYLYNSASNAIDIWSINDTTGALTYVNTLSVGGYSMGSARSILVSPDGLGLYLVGARISPTVYGVMAFSRNTSTGALTLVGLTPMADSSLSPNANWIAMSPDGTRIYIAGAATGPSSATKVLLRNPVSQALTGGCFRLGSGALGWDVVSSDNLHIYTANNNSTIEEYKKL